MKLFVRRLDRPEAIGLSGFHSVFIVADEGAKILPVAQLLGGFASVLPMGVVHASERVSQAVRGPSRDSFLGFAVRLCLSRCGATSLLKEIVVLVPGRRNCARLLDTRFKPGHEILADCDEAVRGNVLGFAHVE
jgi:hypothetical protein